ncbi:MAG: hypothetical protein M3R27_06785 [Bacteroidota bacterium]|nr:hypothetical protein [Bacteroidota bacterium]
MDKLKFLSVEFPLLVRRLEPGAKGVWGVLNAQQMVEHMSDSIRIATGKANASLHTPVEQVEGYKRFAMSDKEFKRETKNALMPDVPDPIRNDSMAEAIQELEREIRDFISYFDNNEQATLTNPFFGDLNFQEWTHLFHKHAVHHSRQFELID